MKGTSRKFINFNIFEARGCDNILQEYLEIENRVIARKASGSEALKKANQYKKECTNK